MAVQAYSCDFVTGEQIDRIPVSAFPYSRLLSAGDSGSSATVPLDGTFTKVEMRNLFQHWSRMLVLERDGVVEYMGAIATRSYARGGEGLVLGLADLWTPLSARGAWDHSAANMSKWSTTVNGSLADHAVAAIRRGRDVGPALPSMALPLTLPGLTGGAISRKYFGYHEETVGDVLSDLMAEGLDIYFKPRWIGNGDSDWLMRAGVDWSSGVTHEEYVTAERSVTFRFSETGDGARVTNNARRVGEGSEEDMLVRSMRDTTSPYPLRDRMSQSKNVSDPAQLTALATQDLAMYAHPTFQWDVSFAADHPVDVGDNVRFHFDGDPWIADGFHTRRVVKISGDLSDVKTVSLQSTGGA